MLRTRPDGSKAFTPTDSLALAEVSLKKIANYLVKDLTTITRDTTMFTIQDKCKYFLGDNTVDLSYQKLLDSREKSLRSLLIGEGIESQVKIHAGKNVIPYDGSSCFRIHYNGVMPKSLRDSYTKLYDLNNGLRRRKYFNAAGR